MKAIFLFVSLFLLPVHTGFAAEQECSCKCVVKAGEKYSTVEASGKDREKAGEALKDKLGKDKCELSPTCSGTCAADTK